jgi:hypothetical protein
MTIEVDIDIAECKPSMKESCLLDSLIILHGGESPSRFHELRTWIMLDREQ